MIVILSCNGSSDIAPFQRAFDRHGISFPVFATVRMCRLILQYFKQRRQGKFHRYWEEEANRIGYRVVLRSLLLNQDQRIDLSAYLAAVRGRKSSRCLLHMATEYWTPLLVKNTRNLKVLLDLLGYYTQTVRI